MVDSPGLSQFPCPPGTLDPSSCPAARLLISFRTIACSIVLLIVRPSGVEPECALGIAIGPYIISQPAHYGTYN